MSYHVLRIFTELQSEIIESKTVRIHRISQEFLFERKIDRCRFDLTLLVFCFSPVEIFDQWLDAI